MNGTTSSINCDDTNQLIDYDKIAYLLNGKFDNKYTTCGYQLYYKSIICDVEQDNDYIIL